MRAMPTRARTVSACASPSAPANCTVAVANASRASGNLPRASKTRALAYHALGIGLGKLELNEEALQSDLDQAWEVLAEPIQTVMRRYGVEGAYEKLKAVTRGKTVAAADLHALIRSLEIPAADKDRLLAMTPASYIGKAAELAKRC